ncbi:hypothetical protein EUA68_01155 [TM7 phylum sp. oral taxon 352]|jgi:hypothetical protein|nr:hypothetical protein EUA68_01155 [TM7 phylum sp. oral taxon 352]
MEAYKVIDPDTLPKLDAKLRAKPFGSGFPMTIEENFKGNDIAKRRGFVPSRKEVIFSPTSIDVGKSSENTRIIMIMGEVAIKNDVFTGRIYASEEGDDGDDNFPELLIV